jgi:hypothetical protein
MQNTKTELARESFEKTLVRCIEEVAKYGERIGSAQDNMASQDDTLPLEHMVQAWTTTAMLCNLGAVLLEIHHQNERIVAALERLEPKGKR